MADFQHLFGPVPSRRTGTVAWASAPSRAKTCNYACIYCQLGRTDHMTNDAARPSYPVEKITGELDRWLAADKEPGGGFDVVTVVGEGEPTLYRGPGDRLLAGDAAAAPTSRWPSSPTARCCTIRRWCGI